MTFSTENPFSGEKLAKYHETDESILLHLIHEGQQRYELWNLEEFESRIKAVYALADTLEKEVEELAKLISLEMGKKYQEAQAEIKKCAWLCRYYAEEAPQLLANQEVKTDAKRSWVQYDPLGIILGIMPWNFPFWQVFRFAIPTILAGNSVLMKHAPNVFGSALAIEKLFLEAFGEGVYGNLIIHHEKVEELLSRPEIRGVSLTGSFTAGSAVASIAGKYVKASLLELGGSNAFVVCEDADLDRAVDLAISARMLNAGQSCIAAKRIIVHKKHYKAFCESAIAKVGKMQAGDPFDREMAMGPLARIDLAQQLEKQLKESVELGAQVVVGGQRDKALFQPSVVLGVNRNMPLFNQESFGPVMPIIEVDSDLDALAMAKDTRFGLGMSIMTQDIDSKLSWLKGIRDGAVFFNDMVKSDPRLPFGGTGISGYGRELASSGIRAFCNEKTVLAN